MTIDPESVFLLLAVLTPFGTYGLVRRPGKRRAWLEFSIGVLVSSIIGWLFLIAGEYAWSAKLESAYKLTLDEKIARQLAHDTGSVMLIYFGGLPMLFWSINVFGILEIISHFRRRSRVTRRRTLEILTGRLEK